MSKVNAIILESDKSVAQDLIDQIESSFDLKCVVANTETEALSQIRKNKNLEYLFCVYDVSDNEEQIMEQSVTQFVCQNYPYISVCSIGSIKKREVTFSEKKVLLLTNDDIQNFIKESEQERKSANLKLRSGESKKRGIHVVH